MSDPLYFKTVTELSDLLEKKEISSVELMNSIAERTEAVEPQVGAFISFDKAVALRDAEASDKRRASGESRGVLDGIPVGIKDILATKDVKLTCGSKILEDFVSPYDATTITKLRDAGAILWGRLNMDEFAMGSSTEHSAFKKTMNPWDLERIPGGSSGGSAAAVAAGQAPFALGTDTGGSIRQPASFCGAVGLKPTYGRVSRYGLAAFASSLDQIGPIARSVEDAAILLQAIAGHDGHDSTSLDRPVPQYREALKEKKAWRIGVPKEFFAEGLSDAVREPIERAITYYKSEGCEIVDISLPHSGLSVPVYYIIAPAEASSNLARYDGVRYTHRSAEASDAINLFSKSREEGFGQEVKRRVILGTHVLSSGYYDAYYVRAQKVRSLVRHDFMQAFNQVDAVLTPTTPSVAFKQGEKTVDPVAMYFNDVYTISANLAGLPAMSIPCGMADGLPVGMHLIGKPLAEGELLAMGHQFESAHDYKAMHPAL